MNCLCGRIFPAAVGKKKAGAPASAGFGFCAIGGF
jgi:hypothetical protein